MSTEMRNSENQTVAVRRCTGRGQMEVEVMVSEEEWQSMTVVWDEGGNRVWRRELEMTCSVRHRTTEDQMAALREMEAWCESHSEWGSEVSLAQNVMEEMRQDVRNSWRTV